MYTVAFSMNKKVSTWLDLAENDLEFAEQILANQQRPYFACNQCHQAMEKILKAVIQLKTGGTPPRIHNLVRLAEQAALPFSDKQMAFLFTLNPHYIGTRYPDDILKLYTHYTQPYSKNLFNQTQGLFLWIKEHLTQRN